MPWNPAKTAATSAKARRGRPGAMAWARVASRAKASPSPSAAQAASATCAAPKPAKRPTSPAGRKKPSGARSSQRPPPPS